MTPRAASRIWGPPVALLVLLAGIYFLRADPSPATARSADRSIATTSTTRPGTAGARPAGGTTPLSGLPRQAAETWTLVEAGGPFPYSRDGVVFGNFEGRLPRKPRGHYREYTVVTPGATTRGARRLIVGRSAEVYYTDDHYNSFRRVDVSR